MGTYENLCADREFCEALGRMTLAASRLESDLRAFLALSDVQVPQGEATFGALITRLERCGLLSENGVSILRHLKKQRNYLTHSLYDLFAARADQGLMQRDDLQDTALLAERAGVLEQNLNGLSVTAEERIAQLEDGQPGGDGLLFRP